MSTELHTIATQLLREGKGILAADQSPPTMNRQLENIGVDTTAENRRRYRQLLFTTAGIEEYVSGIIVHDATLRNQTDTGEPFIDIMLSKGIIPIIKVDKSTVPMTGFPGEVVTEGLDGLAERLKEYYQMGARAAKWRAVVNIDEKLPTHESIKFNCLILARYASLCQEGGIVPIVEPEVIYSGDHDLQKAKEVTTLTLKILFAVLEQYRVDLEAVILKTSMVLAGKEHDTQTTPTEVASATVDTLKEAVPASVPGVVFLSGGQTPAQATANLNAIARLEQKKGSLPWEIAFSFSRGIEQPVQQIWQGKDEQLQVSQQTLLQVLERNTQADQGQL